MVFKKRLLIYFSVVTSVRILESNPKLDLGQLVETRSSRQQVIVVFVENGFVLFLLS